MGRSPLCLALCCLQGELLDKQTCSSKAERHVTTCKEIKNQKCHHICCPHNIHASGFKLSFHPIFTYPFEKMGCGPFRWAVNHSVVPPLSCLANKRVPQRLGGTAPHAKSFKTNNGTISEMLSSKCSSLTLGTAIFAPFLLVFVKKKKKEGGGLRSFPRGTKALCCRPGELMDKQTCSSKAERHRTTCKELQHQRCHPFGDVVVTTLMSQASNYHFDPFSIFSSEIWVAVLSPGH